MASRLDYEAVFAASAVEFFVGLSKRRQRRLLDRARELAADPFLVPDFRTEDASGREISHLMADGFIFDFWVDHAVKQVIITEIDNVE
ncbi:MAG: hypothetical protein HY736_11770 [Verrucomicrobia bacterium]|nr:hypothetical protein [Verrucomicrobiota bacterium]